MATKKEVTAAQLPAVVESMNNWLVAQTGPSEVLEAVTTNLGNESITARDLDRITVPAGGGTTWQVPSLEGTVDVKDLVGVILLTRNPRVYWADSFSGSGSPPDCASEDGMVGVGDPGGECAKCPLAQWGSAANGRGQACHQRRLVFFLTEDDMLPKVLDVPPASLAVVKKYLFRLASKGLAMHKVLTRFGLEKTKNTDGITYGQIAPSVVGLAPNPDFFKKYADTIRPSLTAAAAEFARERYSSEQECETS